MSAVFHIELTANHTISSHQSWFLADFLSKRLKHFGSNHSMHISNGQTIIISIIAVINIIIIGEMELVDGLLVTAV